MGPVEGGRASRADAEQTGSDRAEQTSLPCGAWPTVSGQSRRGADWQRARARLGKWRLRADLENANGRDNRRDNIVGGIMVFSRSPWLTWPSIKWPYFYIHRTEGVHAYRDISAAKNARTTTDATNIKNKFHSDNWKTKQCHHTCTKEQYNKLYIRHPH